MGLDIAYRKFYQEQHPADNTFGLANVSKKITESFYLFFDFSFESTSSDLVQIISGDSIKRLGGDWSDTGFVVGDSIHLAAVLIDSTGIDSIDMTTTIDAIQGGILILSSDITTQGGNIDPQGEMLPQRDNSVLYITNNSRNEPEQVTFYHNLILNDANSSTGSLLDGQVNKFVVEDVEALNPADFGTIIQEGNKSGGRYILDQCSFERIADDVGVSRYSVDIVYFLLSYDESSFDEAEFYDIEQCLKPALEVYGYPQINNPNSALSQIAFNPLANTGWFNENYNEGINDFSIDNVSINTTSGDALSEIDHNQTNVISAKISGTADFFNIVECVFEVIPPEDDFQNNEFSNLDNSFLTYFRLVGATIDEQLSFGKNGGSLSTSSESIDTTTSNSIQVDFELTPNSDFSNYINNLNEEDRRYRISFVVESINGTENDNNSAALTLKQGILTEAPIPDQLFNGVVSQGFLNHVQSIGDSPIPNYVGRTEDDFVFTSKFNLDEFEAWEKMTLDIEVVKTSDGTAFDLFSSSFNFQSNPNTPMVGGVIQLDETQPLAQFLDAPERNKIELKNTGVTASGTYEVQLIWSMMANWRYWITNNQAFTTFYDNTLENDGKNQEWVRYLDLSGYTIRARVRLVKDDIAYYFGGNIDVSDYEDWDGVSEITLYDESNNLVTALLDGQIMKVRADHVLNSGAWIAGDTWGWIAQRGYEQDPNKRLSSFWDWTSQDNPLQPKTGLTTSSLDIVSTNANDDTARIECLIDTSLTNISEFSLTSRIQSPSEPICFHPLQYVFDYIVANAANEDDYVATYTQLLNQVDATDKPICCPPCDIEYQGDFGSGPFYEWAFGTQGAVDNLMTNAIGVDDACCYNSHNGTSVLDECINQKSYDNQISALIALTSNANNFIPLETTLLNAYSDNDILLLTSLLSNLTTDTQIRYDLLYKMIDEGIWMRCHVSNDYKTLTRISA